MTRRAFITLVGGAAAAWPLAARAQQGKMPVIGFLSSPSPGESAGVVATFRQGLRETGFVEGRNLAIAFRWADGRYDSLPPLAAELVDLPVTLIFAAGGPPTAFAGARDNVNRLARGKSDDNAHRPRRIGLPETVAPLGRAVQRSGVIVAIPILSGLHHQYVRI